MAKKVKKSLKAFVEPIGEQINEKIKPIIKATKSSLENDDRQDETINKIIEILDVPEDKKNELLKTLNSNITENKCSNTASFLIVYKDDRYERLAEALRKNLSNNRYSATLVTYKQFKSRINITTDFVIFFDNLDEIPDDKFTVIFDEFGCEIKVTDKLQVVISYGKVNDFDLDEFVRYYQSVTMESLQKHEKLEKLIEERQRKGTFDIKYSEKKKEIFEQIDKKIKEKISPFQSGNPLQKALFEINDKMLPVWFTLSTKPTDITEHAIEKTVNSIIDSNFDSKFTDEAKEQIILTKFFDYIQKHQLSI